MYEHEDLVHESFPKQGRITPSHEYTNLPNFREKKWEHGMPADFRGPWDATQPVQDKMPGNTGDSDKMY